MAKKKKKSVELSEKKIKFNIEKRFFKVIRYYPTAMTVDVMEFDDKGLKVGAINLAFAHIPKEIKKLIKP